MFFKMDFDVIPLLDEFYSRFVHFEKDRAEEHTVN